MGNAIPLIAGSKEGRYVTTGDTLFSNLEKLHSNITAPKPDKCSEARQLDIDLRVRDELGVYIIPSRNTKLAAPNNFLAGKGPSGRADVAQRQAMYDGAVGARGMFRLQNYGNPTPTYNGNAYTLASSYCDDQLKIYAIHPAPPARPGGNPQYCMTQLDSYAMTRNLNSFRHGAAAYRNGQEWSLQQRNS